MVTGTRIQREDMQPEAISDYHLYTVPHRTDLRNNQTKQVALFSADDVKVTKFYVYNTLYQASNSQGRSETAWEGFTSATVGYEIENKKDNNLGLPIPVGVFRLYSSGEGMNSQFLGEDNVPNTPEDRKIFLESGKAFDVTVSEKYPEYKESREPNPDTGAMSRVFNLTKEVTFKNAKDEAVSVRYFQNFWTGYVWRVGSPSLPATATDAAFARWDVKVPAKGETVLTYTMKVWVNY
jgi:hypothetical protein